ncbi:MAG: VOC family protein [Erythrobacter sp.]|jgi:hypothetical protein
MANDRGAFIWYELMTGDAAGAKAFYDTLLGWDIQRHGDPAPGGTQYRMIMRSDGKPEGGVLELTPDMIAHGARPCWLGYVCVPDVDATVKAIEESGGMAHMPATDLPGVGRFAMVADPWGASFYVMTPEPAPGKADVQSDVFSASRPQCCSWNELAATDAQAALDLYTGLFGWSRPEPMDMGEMGLYHFIAHDGETIGAVFTKPAEMPASGWNHYFRVPSIPLAAEAIKAGGGQVLMGPHEVPGGDYIVLGMDPQGASFALVGKGE